MALVKPTEKQQLGGDGKSRKGEVPIPRTKEQGLEAPPRARMSDVRETGDQWTGEDELQQRMLWHLWEIA